jgi:hypothetical protein
LLVVNRRTGPHQNHLAHSSDRTKETAAVFSRHASQIDVATDPG